MKTTAIVALFVALVLGGTANADTWNQGTVSWKVKGQRGVRQSPVVVEVKQGSFNSMRECSIDVQIPTVAITNTTRHALGECHTAGLPSLQKVNCHVGLYAFGKGKVKSGILQWGYNDALSRSPHYADHVFANPHATSRDLDFPTTWDKDFAKLGKVLDKLASKQPGRNTLLTSRAVSKLTRVMIESAMTYAMTHGAFPGSQLYKSKECEVTGVKLASGFHLD